MSVDWKQQQKVFLGRTEEGKSDFVSSHVLRTGRTKVATDWRPQPILQPVSTDLTGGAKGKSFFPPMRHVMPHAAVDPYLRRVQDPHTQRIQAKERNTMYGTHTQ
jgi:hypothetical protein